MNEPEFYAVKRSGVLIDDNGILLKQADGGVKRYYGVSYEMLQQAIAQDTPQKRQSLLCAYLGGLRTVSHRRCHHCAGGGAERRHRPRQARGAGLLRGIERRSGLSQSYRYSDALQVLPHGTVAHGIPCAAFQAHGRR